jgi:hypothetical protein
MSREEKKMNFRCLAASSPAALFPPITAGTLFRNRHGKGLDVPRSRKGAGDEWIRSKIYHSHNQ